MRHTSIYTESGDPKPGFDVENLKTLSDGLLGLIDPVIVPPNGTEFTMGAFSDYNNKITCGTSGCAVGWAPFFGIKKRANEIWINYGERQLIGQRASYFHHECWEWCFSAGWTIKDNSKEGAALRIKCLLEKGLPENWSDQLFHITQLSYYL